MARGGRVIYKKFNRRRKHKARYNGGDDEEEDEDEEYVVGEDEDDESESNSEFDADSRVYSDDEESYEFSEDEEDEEIETARTKKRKQQSSRKKSRVSGSRKGSGRPASYRSKDSDDEFDDEYDDDEDFSPGEDDDSDEDEIGLENHEKKRKAKGQSEKKAVASPARKRGKREMDDSDCDFDVKDRVSVRKKSNSNNTARKKKPSVVSDSFVEFETSDDDFVEKSIVLINKKDVKKTGRSNGRRMKRSAQGSASSDSDYVASDDLDDDLDVKDQDSVDKRKKKGKQNKVVGSNKNRRKRLVHASEPSDFDSLIDQDDEDDEFIAENKYIFVDRKPKKTEPKTRRKRSSEDSASSDFDYLVDEEEDDDGEFVLEDEISKKKPRNTRKKSTNFKTRRKRAAEDSASSDFDFLVDKDEEEDGDFIMDDEVLAVNKKQKKTKKTRKKRTIPKRRRKRLAEDSESSDFDYLVDEDEDDEFIVEDETKIDTKRKNTTNARKKRTEPKTGRKGARLVLDSDLDSLDFDEEISEEEIKDLNIGWAPQPQPLKGLVIGKLKNTTNARKKRTKPKTGRKGAGLVVDSDLDSLDFDEEISEEEIKDLNIGWAPQPQPLKRLVIGKKEAAKGKGKKTDDLGKQLCGICLSEEQKGVVQGLLNCCSHYFCFACIMEWSKVESRCPVCKRRFVTITKSGRSDPGFGMRNAVIRVQKRDQVYQPSEEELRGLLDPYENVVCMECQQGGDDNLMLLCDICDSSAHTYCVGLGREVPEGNWYCECCRSVNEGPSHLEAQVTMTEQGASNSNLNPDGGSFTNAVNTNFPLSVSVPGRASSLRIDLNASPRDFLGDDHSTASPMSGSGASTVFGRRNIHRRIRLILSSSRHRESSAGSSILRPSSEAGIVYPEVERDTEALPVPRGLHALPSVLPFEEWQQSRRSSFRSNASLAPCTFSEGSSFRRVDGAKEEVLSLVKRCLKYLSRDKALDHATLREVAKNSTHTILAACGIHHHRDNVTMALELPDNCRHDSGDGPTHLVKDCCSSCFNSFVEDVVQRLIYAYS